ncbi:MAG TPA: ABC transporter permease [Thermomicrobiales bacterium]|nr:ABC transporter permease [Thermomicrobiales bacterium]
MQSFWAMLVANMKMSARNRAAFFWNLLFPALFILIFPALFSSGIGGTPSIGITGADTPLRQQVTQALKDNGGFDLHEGDQGKEMASLKDGDRSLVIVFPAGELSDSSPIQLLTSSQDDPSGQIALGSVRSALLDILGQGRGIAVTQDKISTLDTTFVDFFVPGILAMSIMNAGMIGLATNFVSYRERGILRRIKVTPLPLWKFILTRIIASLAINLVASAVLIVMARLVWGLHIRGNWFLILGILILGGLAFLGIGYAIAAVSRNIETAAAYGNALTFPMLFLSGVFISVSSMPGWLQPIARILPLRYLVDALREPMEYGKGVSDVWIPTLVLVAFFAVSFAFAVRFFKWDATPR